MADREAPSPTLSHIETLPRNEQTLARVMVDIYRGRLLYVTDASGRGTWHRWERGRWHPRSDGCEVRAAWKAVEELRRAVASSKDEGLGHWAIAAGNERKLRAMAKLAASAPEMVADRLQMDSDRELLSVGNGTLDLRSLELREPDAADLISRGSDVPYLPDARCPAWLEFLERVFKPHPELVPYIQRVCGYLLSGENPEHTFFVLIGQGRNGKGVFVRALTRVLGSLAAAGSFTTFCGKDPDAGAPRPDLLRLAKARLVTVAEGRKEQRLNAALVKTLSGDDDLTARDLYAGADAEVTFRPQFKLVFHTNALPQTDATDDAFWERAQVIPFDVSFRASVPALVHLPADPTIETRIAQELSGILAWMVEGRRQWESCGLEPPECVKAATQRQRDEDDPFGIFLEEQGDELPGDGETIAKAELRAKYEQWCFRNHQRAPTPQSFGRIARRHGFCPQPDKKTYRRGESGDEGDELPF